MNDPRYEVKDPEIKALLHNIAIRLKSEMPPGWGFTLFLFSYGEGGALFYLSSAERTDMIKVVKEFIKKEEAN